jgi:NADH-quinone oxidoreductase subunit A
MPAPYIPLLIFALLVLSFPLMALLVFKLTRPKTPSGPDERNIPAGTIANGCYSARFYVAAMLFVICEVETVFLFPWAVLYRSWLAAHRGAFALISISVFLGILLVGYIWLYKKGALDWA